MGRPKVKYPSRAKLAPGKVIQVSHNDEKESAKPQTTRPGGKR